MKRLALGIAVLATLTSPPVLTAAAPSNAVGTPMYPHVTDPTDGTVHIIRAIAIATDMAGNAATCTLSMRDRRPHFSRGRRRSSSRSHKFEPCLVIQLN